MCDAIIPASSIRPMPKPSTPMLLLMVCSPFTRFRTNAAIRFSGIPQSPKPPIITVAPSGMSATAASELAITLSTHASRAIDDESGFGGLLHVFNGDIGRDFFQRQALRRDPDDGHLRDDKIHNAQAGDRQGTLLQNLGSALLGGVLHGDDHSTRAGHQVHCTAHALYHFSRDHPVGE